MKTRDRSNHNAQAHNFWEGFAWVTEKNEDNYVRKKNKICKNYYSKIIDSCNKVYFLLHDKV